MPPTESRFLLIGDPPAPTFTVSIGTAVVILRLAYILRAAEESSEELRGRSVDKPMDRRANSEESQVAWDVVRLESRVHDANDISNYCPTRK